ncbi:MAG: hypothetical protein JNL79_25155, partial [Myxococcales bacterium]|nr:hypothetical protein [Myxococcales bacterium]
MRSLFPMLLLLGSCGLFGGGSKTPGSSSGPGAPTVKAEVDLACTDGALKWSSSFQSTKVDKCAFHDGEGLEVRAGTL